MPVPSVPPGDRRWWWWFYFDRPVQLSPAEFALLRSWVGLLDQIEMARAGRTLEEFYPLVHRGIIEIPRGIDAHLTLFVGRPALDGGFDVSQWNQINELAPTGSLYCLGIDPDDPTALGEALRSRGYRVIWYLEDPVRDTSSARLSSPPDGAVAVWAWLREPDLMDVRLVDASSPKVEEYRASEGTYPLGEIPPWEPPCA